MSEEPTMSDPERSDETGARARLGDAPRADGTNLAMPEPARQDTALDLESYRRLASTHRFPKRDAFAEQLSAALFALIAEIERLRAAAGVGGAPRFFRHIKGFDDDTLFVRADGDRLTLLLADGRAEPYEFPDASLAHCLAKVERGIWREHELLAAAGVGGAQETLDESRSPDGDGLRVTGGAADGDSADSAAIGIRPQQAGVHARQVQSGAGALPFSNLTDETSIAGSEPADSQPSLITYIDHRRSDRA